MLTDHVAILLHHSLDQARKNRLNPDKPATFFAQVAFPPSAGQDLHALVAAQAPGGQLAGLEIAVHVHSSLKKPIPGVPADYLIVRSSSQYAPTVMDQGGQQLQGEAIKGVFYAGRRIRAALSAFPWSHQTGRKGVSFNLMGVMDAGAGDRLAIGDGVVVNEFQKYAQAGAGAGAGNPFGGASSPEAASTAAGNPFANTGAATSQPPNPFAQ